jgi:tRNA isopentenyl-2-thiomethyl-A-37 hydroxylase MiaE
MGGTKMMMITYQSYGELTVMRGFYRGLVTPRYCTYSKLEQDYAKHEIISDIFEAIEDLEAETLDAAHVRARKIKDIRNWSNYLKAVCFAS